MDATEELFNILSKCIDWNANYKIMIEECIENGADLNNIHPKYRITPLLYGMKRQLHPEYIRLLTSIGFNKDLKIKYSDYIYDSYVGIEYNVTQYKTIKNTILELYYSTIGESKEDHLVEMFTERDYVLNNLHYPLDIMDYSEDTDDIFNQSTPNVLFIESEIDTGYHDMTIYDSLSNIVPVDYKINKRVYKKNIKLIEYIKEYCNILDYDFNTVSSWKLEVPDDFRKYR